ncbi:MAG: hypothetical protein ACHREM_26705 [Polyangiales bacterium]
MTLALHRRERAANSWAFRWAVEVLAARAFHRLSGELAAIGVPAPLVDACAKAARDEERHALICESLARHFGATAPAAIVQGDSLAPATMPREQAAMYDVVARCCVGETESTATVVSLLPQAKSPAREAIQIIARDEVEHARLGWRTLAHWTEAKRDVSFLSDYVPAMLHTGGAPLFDPIANATDLEDDVEAGVYAIPTRRELFEETLDQVIFPGLELHRIQTTRGRQWLAQRRLRLATQ